MPKKSADMGAEFPHGDQLQLVVLILFFVVWGLDSFVFQLTNFLAVFVPLAVRLILAAVTFIFALLLLESSHKMIFNNTQGSPRILDTGIYGRVRHPMYLGTLLVYLAFVLATFSLLSFAVWVGIFLLYDKMASYEEEDLVRLFGDAYRNYQKNVPKWLPRITAPSK
jgi:protein-S-isoprenylcysteine O-methyltransferase Ste14